jgi:TorA-specific chaperone
MPKTPQANTMNEVPLSQIASDRAALYRWFARAFFAPPTPSEVADLQQGTAHRLLTALALTPEAALGIQTMREVLDCGPADQVAAAVGAAHARLFDGVGGLQATPPYRSLYSGERGLLCQQATLTMERVLRQHRLKLHETICEPADHLSIQLEVMAQLALRLAEVIDQQDVSLAPLCADQIDFLAHQLLSWVPEFSRRVAQQDELGFHAGLACVLLGVLQQDFLYLNGT